MHDRIYTLTSTDSADFQPIDLIGAKQVVIKIDSAGASGAIGTRQSGNTNRLELKASDPPLVIASVDGYLTFSKYNDADVGDAYIQVWVIR